MKTYQKILIGLALFLVLIAAGLHFYASWYLEDQIKTTLISEINSNSGGKYELNIEELKLSFLNREILLSGIRFNTTDSAVQQVDVDLSSLYLSGIDISQLLFKREISIGRILLENPSVRIKRDSSETTGSSTQSFFQRAAVASSDVLNNITIPEISVSKLDVQIFRPNEENPYLSFGNSDITLFDTSLNESAISGTVPFKNVSGLFRDIEYQSENGLYGVLIASAEFSSINQTLAADSVSLIPNLSENEFFKSVGFRTDRMEGLLNSITMKGFDFDAYLNDGSLFAEKISLADSELKLFRDKNFPQRDNRPNKPLPQNLLIEADIPLMIDTVSIDGASITYSELAENAEERGFVEFLDIDALLLNTTNIDSLARENSRWTLDASTRVMGKGELDVSFQLPLNEEYHTITGRLNEMNAGELNKALEPIASVRIESGNISNLRFEMRLSETEAIGFVEVIYDDLKISVLDAETGGKNIRSRVTSFLANRFKIESENRAENPRMGTISYQREPEKSFFNYWWKSLRSGLTTSAGFEK